jgi:hypothetical protein
MGGLQHPYHPAIIQQRRILLSTNAHVLSISTEGPRRKISDAEIQVDDPIFMPADKIAQRRWPDASTGRNSCVLGHKVG